MTALTREEEAQNERREVPGSWKRALPVMPKQCTPRMSGTEHGLGGFRQAWDMDMAVMDTTISLPSAFETGQFNMEENTSNAFVEESSKEKSSAEKPKCEISAASGLNQALVQHTTNCSNSAMDSGKNMREPAEINKNDRRDPDFACSPAQLATARCA